MDVVALIEGDSFGALIANSAFDEAVAHAWTRDPPILKINPRHLIPGPNI